MARYSWFAFCTNAHKVRPVVVRPVVLTVLATLAVAASGGTRAASSETAQEEQSTPEELATEAERAFDMFLRDQNILLLQGESDFEFSFVSLPEFAWLASGSAPPPAEIQVR